MTQFKILAGAALVALLAIGGVRGQGPSTLALGLALLPGQEKPRAAETCTTGNPFAYLQCLSDLHCLYEAAQSCQASQCNQATPAAAPCGADRACSKADAAGACKCTAKCCPCASEKATCCETCCSCKPTAKAGCACCSCGSAKDACACADQCGCGTKCACGGKCACASKCACGTKCACRDSACACRTAKKTAKSGCGCCANCACKPARKTRTAGVPRLPYPPMPLPPLPPGAMPPPGLTEGCFPFPHFLPPSPYCEMPMPPSFAGSPYYGPPPMPLPPPPLRPEGQVVSFPERDVVRRTAAEDRGRIHLRSAKLEASCDRVVSRPGSGGLLLEGNVSLKVRTPSGDVHITAPSMVVNLNEGTFETRPSPTAGPVTSGECSESLKRSY